jgi:hypothetical protein
MASDGEEKKELDEVNNVMHISSNQSCWRRGIIHDVPLAFLADEEDKGRRFTYVKSSWDKGAAISFLESEAGVVGPTELSLHSLEI